MRPRLRVVCAKVEIVGRRHVMVACREIHSSLGELQTGIRSTHKATAAVAGHKRRLSVSYYNYEERWRPAVVTTIARLNQITGFSRTTLGRQVTKATASFAGRPGPMGTPLERWYS